MRIGLFSDTYLPDVNGVVSSIVTLQKELEKNGHEVYVIANHKGLLQTKREGNVLRLPGLELKWLYGYILSTPYHFSAKEEIRAMNLDVIHVHTEFGVGMFARIVAKDLNIPIIATYHTMYEDYTHYINKFDIDEVDKITRKVASSFSRIIVDSCEAVIAPSEKTKETLLKYGVSTSIHIIPTGLDLNKFNADMIDPSAITNIKAEFNLADDEKLMLYVGRIAQEKSIDLVIRGFKKVALKSPKYKLMIVGGGPDLDNLKDLAKSIGIDQQVIFTGKQSPDLVPVFYAAATAFVSASTTETQGMTFIEALSTGLPIFARHDDVLEDLIDEGKSGFFFNDEEDFAGKVISYFECDAETVAKMKTCAIAKAQNYDCFKFYQDILAVYDEAIASYHLTFEVKKVKTMDDCVLITIEGNNDEETKVLMSVDDYFAFEIKKDGLIHSSTLIELQLREKILKAWRLCIRKISIKDRTRKEMYDLLIHDNTLEIKQINDMIEKLEEKGYINDTLYMVNEIEKMQHTLYGRGMIIRNLVHKGLPFESVSNALETLSDTTERSKALRYAEKLQHSIKGKSVKMKKQMMKQKLIMQGYETNMANEIVESMNYETEFFEQDQLLQKTIQKVVHTYSKRYVGRDLRNAVLRALIRKGFSTDEVLIAIEEMEIFK